MYDFVYIYQLLSLQICTNYVHATLTCRNFFCVLAHKRLNANRKNIRKRKRLVNADRLNFFLKNLRIKC